MQFGAFRHLFTVLALATAFGLWPGTASAQTFNLLHAFAPVVSGTNADGTLPYGGLALSGDLLYGTTFNAGANSNGFRCQFGRHRLYQPACVQRAQRAIAHQH
jgi:hypothetical protein